MKYQELISFVGRAIWDSERCEKICYGGSKKKQKTDKMAKSMAKSTINYIK